MSDLHATKEPRADGEQVAGTDGLHTRRGPHGRGAGSTGPEQAAASGQRGSAEGGPPTPAAAANDLPPDVVVEPRGIGEERHVLLMIEGTSFELRADEAHAIGTALVQRAEEAYRADGGD